MVQENNEQRNATERGSVAALWPDGEALPVLDAALQQLRLSLSACFQLPEFPRQESQKLAVVRRAEESL
jgi:hypothetical protein